MGILLSIISMLVAIAVGLIITRVAGVALTFTGISRDLARFQARSAYTGVGFTTSESERIVAHPVRRRIVMQLMLLGNAGVAVMVASMVGILLDTGMDSGIWTQLIWLALGLIVIWLISRSKWLDDKMFRIVGAALKKFTRLDIYDYQGLLQLSEGYVVVEHPANEDDWMVGRCLTDLHLTMEGIQVLAIRRADGSFVGTPLGTTFIRHGDRLVLYGDSEGVAELAVRKAGPEGDAAHEKRCEAQRRHISDQASTDRHENRDIEPAT